VTRLIPIAILIAGVVLLSCGGTGPSPAPMLRALDRYERETLAMAPGETASRALETARRNREEAKRLQEQSKIDQSHPFLERALADALLAWALARMERAERQGEECHRIAQNTQQEWENAMIVLEQAERLTERSVTGISRTPPKTEIDQLTPLPPSTLSVGVRSDQSNADLRGLWDLWERVASERGVGIADLATLFDEQIAAAEEEESSEVTRSLGRYLATRTVQLVEARVRTSEAEAVCADLLAAVDLLRKDAERALRATIDLHERVAEQLKAESRSREDRMFEALQKIEGEFARITKEVRGTIVSLADILFDFDKVTLKRENEFNLVRLATVLNQFPEMKITVEGHTDNIGTENYNLNLSKQRARAVHDFLVSQGVSPERMTIEGYGFSRPVADNSTEKGRQRNRRVDLVIRESP
jgi:outer membrane protein OmpA-like peptidoglycan-associated protein